MFRSALSMFDSGLRRGRGLLLCWESSIFGLNAAGRGGYVLDFGVLALVDLIAADVLVALIHSICYRRCSNTLGCGGGGGGCGGGGGVSYIFG